MTPKSWAGSVLVYNQIAWVIMMSRLLKTLTIILCITIGYSETSESSDHGKSDKKGEKLSHSYRVYKNKDTNEVFLTKYQKVYLRLATSPNKGDGQSVLLHSNINLKEAQPFMFLGPGKHKLVHPLGDVTGGLAEDGQDKSNVFSVTVDDDVPQATIALKNAVRHEDGKKIWFGKGLKGSISATDATSGVRWSYYSVNGKKYKVFNKSISFDKEKDYVFTGYGLDQVGLTSEVVRKKFSIDLTPPSTKKRVTSYEHKGNISPKSKIKLVGTDSRSGLNHIHFSISRNGKEELSGLYGQDDLDISKLKQGHYQLSWYGVDQVKNSESKHKWNFYLDRNPPKVNYKAAQDVYRFRGKVWVSARTKIQLSSEDNKAGVERTEYKVGKKWSPYTQPFMLNKPDGRHVVNFRSLDKVGNYSQHFKQSWWLDSTKPKISLKFIGPRYNQGQKYFVGLQTEVSFLGTDKGAGVKSLHYSLDKAAEAKTYDKPFRITSPVPQIVSYYAVDQVNNRSKDKRLQIILDKEAPQVFFHPSSKPVAEKVIGGKKVKSHMKGTSIYVGATDDLSGVRKIMYSVNGSKKKQLKDSTIYLKQDGLMIVDVQVFDNVNNVSNKSYSVHIDNSKGMLAH